MSAIDRFCAAHFDYNGISDDRRREVRRALALFEAHAGRPLETTDAEDFKAWLESLVAEGKHVNTVRKLGNCVRPFYRWAWRDARLIDAETVMRIREVPNPRGASANGLPRPYKRTEMERFWADFDRAWPTAIGQRAWPRFEKGTCKFPRVSNYAMHVQLNAIVHLALHCGLRRSEIFSAGINDIHPDNEYIVVQRGKGGKYREVPFTVDARAAVGEWFKHRRVIMRRLGVVHDSVWLGLNPRASANNPLLPSSPAAPMNRRRFGELMSTIGRWEYHRLRHTCGTEWLRAGMALEKVQVLLGHAKITQTLGYAEVVGRDVVREARRAEEKFTRAVRRAA